MHTSLHTHHHHPNNTNNKKNTNIKTLKTHLIDTFQTLPYARIHVDNFNHAYLVLYTNCNIDHITKHVHHTVDAYYQMLHDFIANHGWDVESIVHLAREPIKVRSGEPTFLHLGYVEDVHLDYDEDYIRFK